MNNQVMIFYQNHTMQDVVINPGGRAQLATTTLFGVHLIRPSHQPQLYSTKLLPWCPLMINVTFGTQIEKLRKFLKDKSMHLK